MAGRWPRLAAAGRRRGLRCGHSEASADLGCDARACVGATGGGRAGRAARLAAGGRYATRATRGRAIMEGMTGTTSVTGRPDGRNERTLTTPAAPPDAVRQTLGRLLETVGAGSVFAAPVVREDVTVIPCAEVMMGLGMGQGSGTGMAADNTGQSEGSGAGGGGGGTSRPVAAIVITQGQVRV